MILMLSALLLGAMQTADAVRVEVRAAGELCGVWFEGKPLTPEELERKAQDWARERREVHVTAVDDAPYRCIGGAIFTVQKAGVNRVGFVSEPDPAKATIYVTARCRVFVDGAQVSLMELRRRAVEWSGTRPEIHFLPDPKARFRCVDRVLAVLKAEKVGRLGFVGNGLAQ